MNRWFDPAHGTWSDDVEFTHESGKLVYDCEGKDETGTFKVRRIHEFTEDAQVYNYQHLRKYAGMQQWLLIDAFKATRR